VRLASSGRRGRRVPAGTRAGGGEVASGPGRPGSGRRAGAELLGVAVAKDDLLISLHAAANRDPAKYACPAAVDLERPAPRALPLICYEAIFPGNVGARDDRPGWIVNLTNDGWFGISTGPYQHLQQARLRAIEEGLPLVRAANTGISAVIDPVGRIVARLGLGIEGVLDSPLPSAIAPTVYARSGDIPAAIIIAAAVIFVIRRRGGKRFS